MVPNIPALAIFHLEMTESGRLPEEVISEHPQQSEEDRSVKEPSTRFCFTKCFEKSINLKRIGGEGTFEHTCSERTN